MYKLGKLESGFVRGLVGKRRAVGIKKSDNMENLSGPRLFFVAQAQLKKDLLISYLIFFEYVPNQH